MNEETNTAGRRPSPGLSPTTIGAMRMAARGLTLTAGPDGCTVAGKTAEDVRKLTGLVLASASDGNTAGRWGSARMGAWRGGIGRAAFDGARPSWLIINAAPQAYQGGVIAIVNGIRVLIMPYGCAVRSYAEQQALGGMPAGEFAGLVGYGGAYSYPLSPSACAAIKAHELVSGAVTFNVAMGIPQKTGEGFAAHLPPEAAEALPFLPWNTAGRPRGTPTIRAWTRGELMRLIARNAARLGAVRMGPVKEGRSRGRVYFYVDVPAAWQAKVYRANRASGPGNTAGAEGDICPGDWEWSWQLGTCVVPGSFGTGDNTDVPGDTTGPGVEQGCGPGTVQALEPGGTPSIEGCVVPGTPCSPVGGGSGVFNQGGFCVPTGGGGTGTGTGGGGTGTTTTKTPGPLTPTTQTPPDGESFFSKYKYEIGGVALAGAVVLGGWYYGKHHKKRGHNPPKGRKGKKKGRGKKKH